ncbi:serine/threonine-protein kinase [Plantactinospora soyae]|uniref:non-specific serine/threonine protein kinase n=1 Tax=Plantactinospora soyae TaxID=1544732 RepID=A0A927M1W6_9ACTN|nr:serine/threonine-protein kinase [Plantactinospora soyae]MBE1485307.1 serine/threonine-protein kinase [Plantactinospora soyae]
MTGWGSWGGSANIHGTELVGERYRLVEELGEGGMSVVWRGHDEVLGRPVAVKMLTPRLANDQTFRHGLRVEARAAARLSHPHITGVYDYGESVRFGRTVPYVVMELVDGESLANRLDREGTLPWRDAVVVTAQVAAALATAHARGVVHRDITPGNVMLTEMGAKVVDFGISALVGERDGDADGELYGTPAYLAPERLTQGEVCPATDVYALGLLLYRMLTGRLPWRAATRTQMLRAHLHLDPAPMPPVPGLPSEVVTLAARSLAKVPADRPGSAELARTLSRVAGVAVPLAGPGRPESGQPGQPGQPGPAVPMVDAGTAILSRTTATGALALPGPRRRRFPAWAGTPLRTAAVGVGLLAATGAVWMGTRDAAAPAGGDAGATNLAAGGAAACGVDYALRTDAGWTFEAEVTVTNLGFRPIRDWTLSFAFPGDQVLRAAPSPGSRQDGRNVLLQPVANGPDAVLPVGGVARFDLVGTYAGSNPLPVAFRLGDTTCSVQVSGVAGESGGVAAGAVGVQPPVSSPTADHPEGNAGPKKEGPGGGPGPDGQGPGGPGPKEPKEPKEPKGKGPKHG